MVERVLNGEPREPFSKRDDAAIVMMEWKVITVALVTFQQLNIRLLLLQDKPTEKKHCKLTCDWQIII